MSQGSADQTNGKSKAAALVTRRPLLSLIVTAATAFFLGVGAGASDSTEPATINAEPASSTVGQLEEELEEIRSDLDDAQDENLELRSDSASLSKKLSSKNKALRKSRQSLSAMRTRLSNARARSASVASTDSGESGSSGTSSSNCDPNYSGTCVPVVSYDLNCDDIAGSVTVVGSDPHGFDGDGDGYGCE